MNNKYINSFILLLLVISLVVINFNQEDELSVTEEGNETLEVVEKSTTSTSTTSTSTTSTSTTSTSTTLPSSTTTTTSFTSPYSEYAGFEGSNQSALDELSTQLPKLMLQIIQTNNIKIINGCHQYGASLNNRCPYGVWDSSGTSPDGTKDADWSLSIWISNRAFSAGVAYDVLLHESLHAFSYSTRNCPKNSTTNYRKDAREFFGGEEYLVDALVLYYGGTYNHYRTIGDLDSNEQSYLEDYINTCTA